jgi:hypothetical protein
MEVKALWGRVNWLAMVTSVKIIESEMGYCAANPFTAHNLSLFYFIYDEAAAVKSPL